MTAQRSSPQFRSLALPRWATARNPDRLSFGPAIGEAARQLGHPLMPWQQLVADVGGELDPSGLPAYREVIVTVPRQSGKTTLVLAWEVQRAIGWGSAQRIAYSAQTGNDARKKLIDDQVPILTPRKNTLGIASILKGMGNEAVVWKNGSRLTLLASSEDSGHGKTLDLAIKDELFADADERRDQALIPAMATRRAAQALTTSTMGTDESVALNRAVARGRQAVEEGVQSGIAYFEWSAHPEDDPDDPEVWWACMPALGITITEDVVRQARMSLSDGEFRRAFLNVATTSDERVIPAQVWDLVCSPTATPEGTMILGFDVNADRDAGSIVAVAGGVAELVFHGPLALLLDRAVELDGKWRPVWAHDGAKSAPVASILPDLKVSRLHPVSDMAAACGGLYDAIADRAISVRRHPDLDAAVAGANRKFIGDGWVWARRGGVDVSPLVALTAGFWAGKASDAPLFAY